MPEIDLDKLASECVQQAVYFSVNPNYLMGVAQMRSGRSTDTKDGRVGPFGYNAEEWKNLCGAEDTLLKLQEGDISRWRFQCGGFSLSTCRALSRFMDENDRYPSAIELYQMQWPDDTTNVVERLQKALDDTAQASEQSIKVIIEGDDPGALVLKTVERPKPVEQPKLGVPNAKVVAGGPYGLFKSKAPGIMHDLIRDFSLTDVQAASIVGNLGHECGGFRLMQELKPLAGAGGYGWAQWTGPRCKSFFKFCAQGESDKNSDHGNYAYLKHELQQEYKSAIAAVKGTSTLTEGVRAFELKFEKAHPHYKHYDRRELYARIALDAYRAQT
jgi:hypothetical protein